MNEICNIFAETPAYFLDNRIISNSSFNKPVVSYTFVSPNPPMQKHIPIQSENLNSKQIRRFAASVKLGNVKGILRSLERGVSPKILIEGMTVLHHAVEMEHPLMLIVVLNKAKNINIDQQCKRGNTALLLACRKANFQITKILLKNGSNPNIYNCNGRTPLHEAVMSRSIIIVQRLLKFGANVNVFDEFSSTPLSIACLDTRFLPMVKMLLMYGADPNAQRRMERSLFLDMCLSCSIKTDLMIIELLLMNGANSNAEDPISKSNGLHYAAMSNNIKLSILLLRFQADVEKENADRMTPCQIARHFKHIDLAIFLDQHIQYLNNIRKATEYRQGPNPNLWNKIRNIRKAIFKSTNT